MNPVTFLPDEAKPRAERSEAAFFTDEGILLVRGADLACHGFYNVCRHRASPIVEGSAAKARPTCATIKAVHVAPSGIPVRPPNERSAVGRTRPVACSAGRGRQSARRRG